MENKVTAGVAWQVKKEQIINCPGGEQIHGLEKSCTLGISPHRTNSPGNKFPLMPASQIPSNARFTLADLIMRPRLCPDAVGSANVNGFPTRNRLSGLIGRPSGGYRAILNMFNIARLVRPFGRFFTEE